MDHGQLVFSSQFDQRGQFHAFGKADDHEIAGMDQEQGGGLLADSAGVIGEMGFIGRADLAEHGAAGGHDFRQAEAAADFDELPARHDDLASGGQGGQGEHGGAGVVVYGGCGFGADELLEQVFDGQAAMRAPASGQIHFHAGVIAGHGGHLGYGFVGQRRAPQPGVQENAGGVNDGPEQRRFAFHDSAGDSLGQVGNVGERHFGGGGLDFHAHFVEHFSDRAHDGVAADSIDQRL